MDYLKISLILSIVLLCTYLYKKIINKIDGDLTYEWNKEKLEKGIISRKDISEFYEEDFLNFSYNVLSTLGFNDYSEVESNTFPNLLFSCTENNENYFVNIIQKPCTTKPNNEYATSTFEEVALEEVELLLGKMIRENLNTAFILTNGNFSKEVLQKKSTLPSDCNIILIDGKNLFSLLLNQRISSRKESVLC